MLNIYRECKVNDFSNCMDTIQYLIQVNNIDCIEDLKESERQRLIAMFIEEKLFEDENDFYLEKVDIHQYMSQLFNPKLSKALFISNFKIAIEKAACSSINNLILEERDRLFFENVDNLTQDYFYIDPIEKRM